MKDYRIAACAVLALLLGGHVVRLIRDGEWGALAVVAVVTVGGLFVARSRWVAQFAAPEKPAGE